MKISGENYEHSFEDLTPLPRGRVLLAALAIFALRLMTDPVWPESDDGKRNRESTTGIGLLQKVRTLLHNKTTQKK